MAEGDFQAALMAFENTMVAGMRSGNQDEAMQQRCMAGMRAAQQGLAAKMRSRAGAGGAANGKDLYAILKLQRDATPRDVRSLPSPLVFPDLALLVFHI